MADKLADILKNLETGLGPTITNCGWLQLWPQVVDERVGKQTEAVKISQRTLYVNAATSTWAQELNYLKVDFIKKFNNLAGQEIIRDIKFKASQER